MVSGWMLFLLLQKIQAFPLSGKAMKKIFVVLCYAGPHLHDYLQQMNKEVLSKYDVMRVAEGTGITIDDAHDFVDEDRHELNMLYHFEGVDICKARRL